MDASDTPVSVSRLGDSLAQAATSQRQLFQDITTFAKDESTRFLQQRLERTSAAMEKLQAATGLAGVIGAQQEWLRDLMQDYAAQQMRLAGAFRGLARNAVSDAAEAATDGFHRMHQTGREMADAVNGQVREAADEAATYAETQH